MEFIDDASSCWQAYYMPDRSAVATLSALESLQLWQNIKLRRSSENFNVIMNLTVNFGGTGLKRRVSCYYSQLHILRQQMVLQNEHFV